MHSSLILALTTLATISQALPNAYETEIVSRSTNPATQICLPKSPAPTALKCETEGDLGSPSVLQSKLATNADREDSCRDGCESLKKCKAFSWNPFVQPGGCVYYTKPISQMSFTASSSGNYVSDRGCYACQACKITLQNGDFESGSTSPWADYGDGQGLSIVSPGAGGSSNALQVIAPSKLDSPYNNGGGFTQDFGQCMGKNYTVSFDYKVTKYASTTFLVLWHESGNYQEVPTALYQTFNDPVGDWKHVTFNFVPDFNNYGYILFRIIGRDNNRATYEFDNIAIVPTPA